MSLENMFKALNPPEEYSHSGLKTTFLDPYEFADEHTYTMCAEGLVDPAPFAHIPGGDGEEKFFEKSPWGRMDKRDFLALVESLRAGWNEKEPILIFVEKSGEPHIHEGNHRLRAAIYAKIPALIEVRYFGNSQDKVRL